MKYIDANKLIKSVNRYRDNAKAAFNPIEDDADYYKGKIAACEDIQKSINSLRQEQSDLPSGEDVMTMCNQILIDWVKEGKTQEEIEQREQAHIRFFELYDDYLMQEQPEVDLEKEIAEHAENMPHSEFTHESECVEHEEWAKIEFRHFYSLGLNARNV